MCSEFKERSPAMWTPTVAAAYDSLLQACEEGGTKPEVASIDTTTATPSSVAAVATTTAHDMDSSSELSLTDVDVEDGIEASITSSTTTSPPSSNTTTTIDYTESGEVIF